MKMRTELGEFLRSRRARITPDRHGLPAGRARRVPGLRREETARLAGISPAYYTRLEQGAGVNASDQVLGAIARVLLLDATETAHLFDLARPAPAAKRRRPPVERAPKPVLDLLDSMPQVPAVLLGRRNDVLGWNQLAHRLLAGHLDFDAPADPATRPSATRMLFLDARTRAMEADWEHYARTHVAYLRMLSGRRPDDRALAELIGELTIRSAEFATMWASGNVRECTYGDRTLHHPEVGTLTVTYHAMNQPAMPDHRIEFYTAEPGSPSSDALGLLVQRTASVAATSSVSSGMSAASDRCLVRGLIEADAGSESR
ncbi:helix-turn-helix transcriptional regulator [Streptomyces sp. NPDC056304]|uniref:helix-turn-helix transcriptional regulator n=1 Tax=Streptomyces sp. NPDC056304 TaxID=3345778 RepID=UPI0035D8E835